MPDKKEMRTMEPHDLIVRAIKGFDHQLKLESAQEDYLEQLKSLGDKQVSLFATYWCDAMVRNGGFYQFFRNSTGILGPEAKRGFERIGLPAAARILDQAMKMLGAAYPRDWKGRTAVLKKIHKPEDLEAERSPFEAQDDAYYEAVKDYEGRADEFVRANLNRFFV